MVPQETIERVKAAANTLEIVQLFSSVELKKQGTRWFGRCPITPEKSDSFSVHPGKNRYKCYGCGAQGGGIDFLMQHNNMTFMEAIAEVAALKSIELDGRVPEARLKVLSERVEAEKPMTAAELAELERGNAEKLAAMVGHARKAAKGEAAEYLQARGIDTASLPSSAFYGSGPYTAPDGRTFPAAVVFISSNEGLLNKRFVGPLPEGMPKSYNKGALQNAFYTETLRQGPDVWVTEGVINALSIYNTGRSAVATFATGNLYSDTGAVRKWASGRRVVLAADGDRAGKRYIVWQANWLLNNADVLGIKSVFAFVFPDPELDANDLLKAGTLERELANKFNMQKMTAAFCTRELAKMVERDYIPEFEDRLELNGFSELLEKLRYDSVAYLVNSDQKRQGSELQYIKGQYALLPKLAGVVRVVRFVERQENIYEDNWQETETDVVKAAKVLIQSGIDVRIKGAINWETDEIDDPDDPSFIDWYTRMLATLAPEYMTRQREVAIQRAAEFMASLPASTYIVEYDKVRKRFDLSKGDWNTIVKPLQKAKGLERRAALSTEEEDIEDPEVYSNASDLPPYVDRQFFVLNGFYKFKSKKGKEVFYMMRVKDDIVQKVSNFTLHVVGHLVHHEAARNKRIVRVVDISGHEMYMEIESSALRSKEEFDKRLFQTASLFFFGTKAQYERILAVEDAKTPQWHELDILGQQPEDVFAFEDGLWDYTHGVFKPANEVGTVEWEDYTFYSPNVSSINSMVRGKKKEEQAGYLRYMKYKSDQNADFARWSYLMGRVFSTDGAGIFAQVYVCMSAFKDLIASICGHFPLYFLSGETNAGKSQVAESIVAPFTGKMKFQNLNSDTDAAFFVMLEKFRNVPIVFDEYDENKISDIKFQALKAAYDGIGKTKKKDATSKQLDISEINAAVVFLGQYIPEKDDYALFNRSLSFFIAKRDFTPDDESVYEELRKMEEKGCTNVLCDILRLRAVVKAQYKKKQSAIKEGLKQRLTDSGKKYVERILNTASEFLAMASIMCESELPFAFDYATAEALAENKLISLSEMVYSSNKISVFFKSLEFLLVQEKIVSGREFKIESRDRLKERVRGELKDVRFKKKEVIFLRMNLIEDLYRNYAKADAMKSSTLNQYLGNHEAFLGKAVNEDFSWVQRERVAEGEAFIEKFKEVSVKKTTAIAFDYDMLGIDMQRSLVERVMADLNAPKVEQDLPF